MKQNKIPRNEYIIKPKGKIDPYKDDVQYGGLGQLRYPYQVTKIPGDTMSTEGYGNIPLWTVPDVGPPRMVYPNTGNQFFAGANNFTEYPMKYPMARYGGGLPRAQNGRAQTPEEWGKEIRNVEHQIGNPSTWTLDSHKMLQDKLNEYKAWRENTPEGKAVIDYHNEPNEYVVPLPSHLQTVPKKPFGGIHTKTNTHMATGGWLDTYDEGGIAEELPIEETVIDPLVGTPTTKPLSKKQEYQNAIKNNYSNYIESVHNRTPFDKLTSEGHMNCIHGVCTVIEGTKAKKFNQNYTGNMTFADNAKKEGYYKVDPNKEGFEIGDVVQYAQTKEDAVGDRFNPKSLNPVNAKELVPQHAKIILDKYVDSDGITRYKVGHNGGTEDWQISTDPHDGRDLSETSLLEHFNKGFRQYDGIIVNRYDPDYVQKKEEDDKVETEAIKGKNQYASAYKNPPELDIKKQTYDSYGKPIKTEYTEAKPLIDFYKKNYQKIGKSADMPPEILNKLFYNQIGIAAQETEFDNPLTKRAIGKALVPDWALTGARKVAGMIGDDSTWVDDYWKKNADGVQDKYNNVDEFKKHLGEGSKLSPEGREYLYYNSPKSKGMFQQKELSKRGRILNSNFDTPENQFVSSMYLAVDNYHLLKKKYPDLSNDQLVDLTTLMHNAPSKALTPEFVNYYLKNNDVQYVNDVKSKRGVINQPDNLVKKIQNIQNEKIVNKLSSQEKASVMDWAKNLSKKKYGGWLDTMQVGGDKKGTEKNTLELPEVVTTPWTSAILNYEDVNPKESYINNLKQAYLNNRNTQGLNKLAGLNMENFPSNVEQEYANEYLYKRNNSLAPKIIDSYSKSGDRTEWVDKLTEEEKNIIKNSDYRFDLEPNAFATSAAGLSKMFNYTGMPERYNAKMLGITENESKDIGKLNLIDFLNVPGQALGPSLRSPNLPGNPNNAYMNNSMMKGLQGYHDPQRLAGEEFLANPLNWTLGYDAPALGYALGKGLLSVPKVIKASKELPGSPNVTSVTENIANKFNAPIQEKPSWVLHEPQSNTLQIKSTMTGSPLEKQLSKTGEINVNNIKTHIGKSEVGQQDKFIVDKVLNEKFAGKTKIDYNDFRKAVSEELVPLERNTLVDSNTNWGVSRLGYPASKKSTYDGVLKHGKEEIDRLENLLKHDGNIEPTTWETSDQIRERLKVQLTDQKLKYKNNLKEYENLPLENNSITYSNSSKFGKGSADHFDESTLGHARTLVSKDEPDVMHILEQQSDYYQKNPLNKAEQSVKDRERILNEVLNDAEMKKVYGDDYNKLIVDSHEKNLAMAKDKLEQVQNTVYNNPNPVQKEFLGKTHQERLLQENVLHAAEQGKSKMRYPTSETAAKVQGYFKMDLSYDQHPDFKHVAEKMRYADANLSNAAAQKEAQEAYMEYQKAKEINPEKFFNYSPEHQTILKKYDDTPKMIKKVLGKEAKVVTDPKGNTWYEFDIPDAAKKGKFEIKAFALGGGLLDDEFRRGGQKRLKKYTSKNIQSSVNDIMLRNETLFGPAGKKRYKPGLKYKDGGWLDNLLD
jgi:hypothetical protein